MHVSQLQLEDMRTTKTYLSLWSSLSSKKQILAGYDFFITLKVSDCQPLLNWMLTLTSYQRLVATTHDVAVYHRHSTLIFSRTYDNM